MRFKALKLKYALLEIRKFPTCHLLYLMSSNYNFTFFPSGCNKQLPCDLDDCMEIARAQYVSRAWGCHGRCCIERHNTQATNQSIEEYSQLCAFLGSEKPASGTPCSAFEAIGQNFDFRIDVTNGTSTSDASSSKPSSGSSTASPSFLGQMGLLMLILHIFL